MGRAAGGGSSAGNGNSTILIAHVGGVALAATFGFAVAAAAVVDGGEWQKLWWLRFCRFGHSLRSIVKCLFFFYCHIIY